jgi:hypothetical protein
MVNQIGKDSVRAGLWAARLFVLGLLGPFGIALVLIALQRIVGSLGRGVEPGLVGVWFCFLSQVLAVVFGVLGRKTVFGKIGLFGGVAVLAFFVLMGIMWAQMEPRRDFLNDL